MDLILEVRTGRERVTMVCHGKLVGGKEADTFRRSAMLLLGGFDKLTINLAGVRAVDCGGGWEVWHQCWLWLRKKARKYGLLTPMRRLHNCSG